MDATQTSKWAGYHKESSARQELPLNIRMAWERAVQRKINPYSACPMEVPLEARAKIKADNKRLFVCAQSLFHATKYMVKENGQFCLLLFSKEGVLLAIYHYDQMNEWLSEHKINVWTNWSEDYIGPNIFSVGIKEKSGTTMVGAESYAHVFTNGAWYFSSIFDGNDDLLGGFALVTTADYASEYLEYLAFALSKNIELHFAWFGFFHNASSVTEGMGFMSIDQSTGENRILTMGEEIFKMLGVNEDNYVYKRLEEYIDPLPANAEFWNMMNRKDCVSDKTIRLICHGRASEVCISTSIFKEPTFHIDGLVVIFNSYSRIQP